MARKKALNETPIHEGNAFELLDAARDKFLETSQLLRAYQQFTGHLMHQLAKETLSDEGRRVYQYIKSEMSALGEDF